jgi:hypothetical protein
VPNPVNAAIHGDEPAFGDPVFDRTGAESNAEELQTLDQPVLPRRDPSRFVI